MLIPTAVVVVLDPVRGTDPSEKALQEQFRYRLASSAGRGGLRMIWRAAAALDCCSQKGESHKETHIVT